MRATFTSRLLKCKDYVKLRSRYRKLQSSVSDSETRLTTLDQNQQSIVEQCNQRMKRLSTKLKGFRGELQACNNRIKILEQKLLLTNVHVESIQGGCPDFTETGSCSSIDLQLDKAQAEAAATTEKSKRPEIDPKKFKEVKIIVERLNILKFNSTTSDQQGNIFGGKQKESPYSNSDPDLLPQGDPNTAGTDSLLPEDIKPIICPICQMAIGSETDLQNHTKSHLLLFECVLCDASFSVQEEFKKHIIKVHAQARKTLACSKCDLTFRNKYSLKRHNNRFHGVHSCTGFNCSICNKTFKRKEHLKNHLATHSEQRPFSCPKCAKSFSRQSTLNEHLTSHSKRVNSCELCASKFIYRRSLKSHILKIHGKSDPDRLFACTVKCCEREFGRKSQLRAHSAYHRKKSNPDDFKCSICQIRFTRLYSLARHNLRKHGKENDKPQPSVTPDQDLSHRVTECQT